MDMYVALLSILLVRSIPFLMADDNVSFLFWCVREGKEAGKMIVRRRSFGGIC